MKQRDVDRNEPLANEMLRLDAFLEQEFSSHLGALYAALRVEDASITRLSAPEAIREALAQHVRTQTTTCQESICFPLTLEAWVKDDFLIPDTHIHLAFDECTEQRLSALESFLGHLMDAGLFSLHYTGKLDEKHISHACLSYAVVFKNVFLVELIVKIMKQSPNDKVVCVSSQGSDKLFCECLRSGNINMIHAFLASGRDINARFTVGIRDLYPIEVVVYDNKPRLVKILVEEYGARKPPKKSIYESMIGCAKNSGHVEMFVYLCSIWPPPPTDNAFNMHVDCLRSAIVADYIDSVRNFVEAGKKDTVYATVMKKTYALHIAAAHNSVKCIGYLLDEAPETVGCTLDIHRLTGLDIFENFITVGATPLDVAIYRGNVEAAKILFAHGATITAYTQTSTIVTSPMYTVNARTNMLRMMKLVCANGGDIDAKKSTNLDVLHEAIMLVETSVIDFLLKEKKKNTSYSKLYDDYLWWYIHNHPYTPLVGRTWVERNHGTIESIAVCETFYLNGIDLSQDNNQLLKYAVKRDAYDLVKYLLSKSCVYRSLSDEDRAGTLVQSALQSVVIEHARKKRRTFTLVQ